MSVGSNGLREIARFAGREWSYALDGALAGAEGVSATLLRGTVETGGAEEAVRRLRLAGPVPGVAAACAELGAALGLAVPRGGLPAGVLGLAPAPPGIGAAVPGMPVGAFVAGTLPALTWPVLLGTAALAAEEDAARVHETRVAVRRLRSVLGVLRAPTACAATEALGPMLRDLAGRLGAARDWDVFLEGLGARLEERFGGDDTARLLAAARRRRAAAYAALRRALAGPDQGALERQLALVAALRPWEAAPAPPLADDAAGFAAEVLRKRLRRVRKAGQGFAHLAPEALHALRKDAKRLRYAAETFAPLFPDAACRRFLKRLRVLQGALGELQDAEVAHGLLARLGDAGHGYAGGLAIGMAEGRGQAMRADASAAWRRFRKADAFWT